MRNTRCPTTLVRTALPSIKIFASALGKLRGQRRAGFRCLPSMTGRTRRPRLRHHAAARSPARRATSISTLSPAAWPNTSLTLQPVEVDAEHGEFLVGSPHRPDHRVSACRKAARFGRSVRPS